MNKQKQGNTHIYTGMGHTPCGIEWSPGLSVAKRGKEPTCPDCLRRRMDVFAEAHKFIERMKLYNDAVRTALLNLAYEHNIDPDFAFELSAGHLTEWVSGAYQRRMRKLGLTMTG